MDMKQRLFYDCGGNYVPHTPEEQKVIEIMFENEDLFTDMVFKPGSSTYELVKVKVSFDGGLTYHDDETTLPECLEYFSYDFFEVKVKRLKSGICGQYNKRLHRLTIAPTHVECVPTILHEMIHLYEDVVNSLRMFYHDAVLWSLYKDLQEKIPDLDSRIATHGHILNEQELDNIGGVHDILFLLKSFDLDLRKGYKLGTVFGYGIADEYGAEAVMCRLRFSSLGGLLIYIKLPTIKGFDNVIRKSQPCGSRRVKLPSIIAAVAFLSDLFNQFHGLEDFGGAAVLAVPHSCKGGKLGLSFFSFPLFP